MTDQPLHPDARPLELLLGTWRGRGRGEYPTIEPFDFEEETCFSHTGAAFLSYRLQTWNPESGSHLHSERGFWRAHPGGGVDVTLAHPLGLTEIAEGTLADGRIGLVSTGVQRAPRGASPVTVLERRYQVSGDTMDYEVLMATDTVPLVLHIVGALERVKTP